MPAPARLRPRLLLQAPARDRGLELDAHGGQVADRDHRLIGEASLVLALLRKVYPKAPISTFSLAKSKHYSDIVFARKVADLFKTEHHEIILSDEEYGKFRNEYDKVKKETTFRG